MAVFEAASGAAWGGSVPGRGQELLPPASGAGPDERGVGDVEAGALDADRSGEGREGAYEVAGVGAVGGGVVPGLEGDVAWGVEAGDVEGFPGEGAGFAGHMS